jgi:hypothetical protein
MKFDKTLTPEQQWEKAKEIIFKGEVPDEIENLMQRGFAESNSDSEKWIRLSTMLLMIENRFR